ncbi:MAG TPA: glycogen/starch synthase, partial [Candidatus Polarisedimenticolaceae bacterium]|nr:glycogen/starch synthase [Candidatus Polarisedimenticolaceae bacterium]
MKVLMASAELHPLAKAGGLADMVAALGRELGQQGVEVRCAVPGYRVAHRALPPHTHEVGAQEVTVDTQRVRVRHLEAPGLP